MFKKAILGGTFDPIHNGHINVAYEALEKFNLDKVIFMPAGNPPHKINSEKTDANIRYHMVKKAVEKEKKFEVSDYEIKSKEISYTYKTLRYFNKLEPNTQWFFITGEDCFSYLDNWKNIEEIFDLCTFVVFSREGFNREKEILKKKYEIMNQYKGKISFINAPILDISSTRIRQRIKENKEVSFYIPYAVYEFIKEKGLYN